MLVRPGATRFGTQVIMIARFLEVKLSLKEMVISEEWGQVAVARKEEGRAVRRLLLQETFWESVGVVLCLMNPIYEVLRVVDRRSLVMGQIYGLMLDATVKTNEAATAAASVKAIIAKRWDGQLHNPLHALGWLLNPRNQYVEEVQNDAEVREGAEAVIQAREGSVEKRMILAAQIASFHKGEGRLGAKDARWAATTLVASGRLTEAEWWAMFGGEVRALRDFAVTTLSQPVTSSAVERYWSALAQVQRRDRNRLNATTMTDVAFVAFGRRAQAAHDRKAELRAKLYEDLSNGSLNEGSILTPTPEEVEVDAEEEGGEPCTIDWDNFGSIGKRAKKRHEELCNLHAIIPQLSHIFPDITESPSLNFAENPTIPIPLTVEEALSGPHAAEWRAAMDAEIEAFTRNHSFDDDTPPPGVNIVGGKWLFRVKQLPDEALVFKVRYVAKGFTQQQYHDFFKTFSPTSKPPTIRTLMDVAA
ncbi:unnamed protein product [Closterium sp. NIES-53]